MTTTYSVQIQAVAIKQLHIIKKSEVGETLQTKKAPWKKWNKQTSKKKNKTKQKQHLWDPGLALFHQTFLQNVPFRHCTTEIAKEVEE